MTAEEAKAYAKTRLKAFGWEESEFSSLEKLWEKESNWNYKAKNPKSGALGIPQLLGGDKVPNYATDYKVQIEHGLSYIKNRKGKNNMPKYGSPTAAWNFHIKNGWY
jgi:hypothetical protein